MERLSFYWEIFYNFRFSLSVPMLIKWNSHLRNGFCSLTFPKICSIRKNMEDGTHNRLVSAAEVNKNNKNNAHQFPIFDLLLLLSLLPGKQFAFSHTKIYQFSFTSNFSYASCIVMWEWLGRELLKM